MVSSTCGKGSKNFKNLGPDHIDVFSMRLRLLSTLKRSKTQMETEAFETNLNVAPVGKRIACFGNAAFLICG